MISRIIGRGCLSLLMWLYGSHLVSDLGAFAGIEDNIMQSAKEGGKEGVKDGVKRRLHSVPERILNSAVPKALDEPIRGPSALTGPVPSSQTLAPNGVDGVPVVQEGPPIDPPDYTYRGDGRRDPFMAIVQDANKAIETNLNVPPLQRVNLSEITLIGIVSGGFGYIAMVQTPDGRGYTVREGTRIGSSDGLVSVISAEALTVKEPFLDIFGKKEMREHVISLHPKVHVE